MKKQNKPTLSIGIPAFNEQGNIQNLLKKLLAQKTDNFELLEIIVNSDGSNDQTVAKAKTINDQRIKVIDNSDRKGKIKRVNQIFELGQGDIISIIDADAIPVTQNTFNHLIEPFINDSEVVYVSGRPFPLKPKNFVEKAVLVARSVWDKVRDELKDGHSVYTCHGILYGLKKEFAKSTPFPDSIWADIGFHYFYCLKNNLKYKPTPKAGAYFRLPSTVRDHINQISRYKNEDKALIEYFGPEIEKEYLIPSSMLKKYKLQALINYPLHSMFMFVVNYYATHAKKTSEKTSLANWSMINTTKEEIKND